MNFLDALFEKHTLRYSRRDLTADGSLLFEFGNKACADFYPSGEIVVIVREGGCDNVYELGEMDSDLIASLLKDAISS